MALAVEHLSLWGLYEANLEGGLIYWGSWEVVHLPGTSGDSKQGLWKHSISLWGFYKGNLEGGLLYWES